MSQLAVRSRPLEIRFIVILFVDFIVMSVVIGFSGAPKPPAIYSKADGRCYSVVGNSEY